MRNDPGPAGSDELARLRDRIARDAHAWYPTAPAAAPRVDGGALNRRDRARLYRFTVQWPAQRHDLLAKVTSLAGEPSTAVARPRLADPSDYAEKHACEFRALERVHERLHDVGDPRLRAVRPLAHDADLRALIMEHVPGGSLRTHLNPAAAWHPARRADVERSLTTAGAWLRMFHGLPAEEAPARRGSAQAFRDDLDAYIDFLASRTRVPDEIAGLVATAGAVADDLLADTRLVVNHGDCAPRNFLVDGGRVAGIDMIGRWRVPCVEDIGYFLLSLRLVGPRVASGGVAYPPGMLERWCSAFVTGYGSDRFPAPMLDAYGVLLLLDRWAAALARPAVARGVRSAAAKRLEIIAVAGEARRLRRALA